MGYEYCVCGVPCNEDELDLESQLCRDGRKHRDEEIKCNTYLSSFQSGDLLWLYDELCLLSFKGEVWWEIYNVETNQKEVWCPFTSRTYRHLMNILRHSNDR